MRPESPARVLRIFLSSTAADLTEHRALIATAFEELGQQAVRMETFGARDGTPLDECRDLAAGADALVVCVAHRYGWVPSAKEGGDGERSITWHEVQAALDAGKPVFAFLVDPGAPWTAAKEQDRLLEAKTEKQAKEVRRAVQGLQRFREFLGCVRVRATFSSPEELARKVATSVSSWLLEQGVGAVSENDAAAGRRSEILDFAVERSRHTAFYGREDVLAELDRLLDPKLERGWVLVTAGPGMGKSAILSRYLDRLEKRGQSVPHHFLRRGAGNSARIEAVVQSLSARVETLYPEQADPDVVPANRLVELLGRVSREVLVPRGERLVLVVDGLDEAETEGAANPLPRFLPSAVPPGVFILCASRPTYPDLGWLEARDRLQRLDLDGPRWAGSNGAAVEAFWEQEGPKLSPPLDPSLIRAAIERAGGNLLYAVKLREWLEDLPPEERGPAAVPRGLEGFLTEVWGHLQALNGKTFALVEEALGILCAAREALPAETLDWILRWEGTRPRSSFLRHARPLLLEEAAPWAGGKRAYRLFHESFRTFLVESLGAETLRAHHRRLVETLSSWPGVGPEPGFQRRYALRHGVFHRVEAGEREPTEALATDLGYLEACCRAEGVQGLEADLRRALLRWPGQGAGSVLASIERAIRTESHHLQTDPGAIAVQLYTTLRGEGWTEVGITTTLRLPPGKPHLRLTHPLQKRGPVLRTLVGHGGGVNACALTPDGRCVVFGSNDGKVKVWDPEHGTLLTTFEGHAREVNTCAVSPDGQRVVSGSSDHTVKVWSLEGALLATLEGDGCRVWDCAVTADGRRAVLASSYRMEVWDLEHGALDLTLARRGGRFYACAVSPDGRRVVSGSGDGTVKVWDLKRGNLLATLEGHVRGVNACAVAPDGHRVVSGSNDGTVKVWDLKRGSLLATLEGHGDGVNACAVTADGRHVISGSSDRTVKVWDLERGALLATLEGHGDRVNACAVAADGSRVVSGSDDDTVKVWNLEQGARLTNLKTSTGGVNACAVTPDGRHVVSGSDDGTVKVWDLKHGELLATLEGHSDYVKACAVTPDGRRVISGSGDGTAKVWDLEHGDLLATLEGHGGRVNACAVTPDGRCVVWGSSDSSVKVWDLEHSELLATLEGHGDGVNACAVTPDGRRVVSGAYDTTLKVWDLEHGELLATLEGRGGWVNACAVTPDGRRVVSGSNDGTVAVWDLEHGALLSTLKGHGGAVTACAVTPDGRRVISGSYDGTLKVWDLERRATLETLHGGAVFHSVHVSGDKVAAGDGTGNVWMLRLCAEPETEDVIAI